MLLLIGCFETFHYSEFGGFGTLIAFFANLVGQSAVKHKAYPVYFNPAFSQFDKELQDYLGSAYRSANCFHNFVYILRRIYLHAKIGFGYLRIH